MTNIIESVENTSENVKVAVKATGEVIYSNAKDLYNDIINVAKEKKYIDKAVQEEEEGRNKYFKDKIGEYDNVVRAKKSFYDENIASILTKKEEIQAAATREKEAIDSNLHRDLAEQNK